MSWEFGLDFMLFLDSYFDVWNSGAGPGSLGRERRTAAAAVAVGRGRVAKLHPSSCPGCCDDVSCCRW